MFVAERVLATRAEALVVPALAHGFAVPRGLRADLAELRATLLLRLRVLLTPFSSALGAALVLVVVVMLPLYATSSALLSPSGQILGPRNGGRYRVVFLLIPPGIELLLRRDERHAPRHRRCRSTAQIHGAGPEAFFDDDQPRQDGGVSERPPHLEDSVFHLLHVLQTVGIMEEHDGLTAELDLEATSCASRHRQDLETSDEFQDVADLPVLLLPQAQKLLAGCQTPVCGECEPHQPLEIDCEHG